VEIQHTQLYNVSKFVGTRGVILSFTNRSISVSIGTAMKNIKKPGYSPCQKAEMKYVAIRDLPVLLYVYLSSHFCVRLFQQRVRFLTQVACSNPMMSIFSTPFQPISLPLSSKPSNPNPARTEAPSATFQAK
jgi:hypothetical protein